jgi:thymidylate synthase ThyX
MKPKRTDELTEQEKQILKPYVTDVEGPVFSLHGLNPEVIGAALARYSRAPTGIRETIAREFLNPDGTPNEVKGTELIDRVVNKFGDESVAELAVAPLCIEEISNLMTKVIEDCRIGGSPIEESTRYVLYHEKKNGEWRHVRPARIMQSGLRGQFLATMDFLFQSYADMVEPMQALFRCRLPEKDFAIEVERADGVRKVGSDGLENDDERRAFRLAYAFTIRSAACDVIRCILPSATQANMGIVGNGRFFSGLIVKLLSHDLSEANTLGEAVRSALSQQIPTFIKRAGRNEYLVENENNMRRLAAELFSGVAVRPAAEVALLEVREADYETNLIAGMLYPFVRHSTAQVREVVGGLPAEKRRAVFDAYVGRRRSKRDRPGRALEYGYPIEFDIIAGFAEYRDLQRHRMLTQQRQELGVHLGYSIPQEVEEIGRGAVVRECFSRAESLYHDLWRGGLEREAQYAILFNHLIRWNMGMNVRELGHLVELRSQRAGHAKYRRLAQTMARLYLKKHPNLAPLLQFVDYNDYDQGISRADQEARTARKSLASGVFDDLD